MCVLNSGLSRIQQSDQIVASRCIVVTELQCEGVFLDTHHLGGYTAVHCPALKGKAQEQINCHAFTQMAYLHIQEHTAQTHITDTPRHMVGFAVVNNSRANNMRRDADAGVALGNA